MIRYWYQDGAKVKEGLIEGPPSPAANFLSCYLFTFPKAGSVFVNYLVETIMEECGVPIINVPSYLFAEAITVNSVLINMDELFKPRGYCYTGFRGILPIMRGGLKALGGTKVLLVRDPRDMLVSNYYSLKFSHPFPKKGTVQFFSEVEAEKRPLAGSIDDFCISNTSFYNQMYADYIDIIDDKDTFIIRYEDVVFDKVTLAERLCEILKVHVSAVRIQAMVDAVDLLPAGDRENEHIRQVHPGDHRRKLQPETIALINIIMKDFIRKFDYA